MSSTSIHWGRILLGGLLAEAALILAIVPLGLRLGDNFLHYTAPLDPSSCASWERSGYVGGSNPILYCMGRWWEWSRH